MAHVETHLAETSAAVAEANALRILGDLVADAFASIGGRPSSDVAGGSAGGGESDWGSAWGVGVYEGTMSHEHLGENLPLRLKVGAPLGGGSWRGEWAALGQTEQVDVARAASGELHIRTVHGENVTELTGCQGSDGVLQGNLLQDGLRSGSFELRPVGSWSPPRVPSDWATVTKGRDLFVTGWGGFDVAVAYKTCRAVTEGPHGMLPSVEELRSYGYVEKFFPEVLEPMHRERLRKALLAPSSLGAKYVARHCAFWSDTANANRLDEVLEYLETQAPAKATAAAILREPPRALLNRLLRDRAVAACPQVQFAHLVGVVPAVHFSASGAPVAASDGSTAFELSVLEDSQAVVQAALELNNCAADYVGDVRRKRCALVVLKRHGKLAAMGEWDLHRRQWSQISEHSDEQVRGEWQAMYEFFEGDWLFPVEASIMLQGCATGRPDRGKPTSGPDSVSLFHPAAARSIESLCKFTRLGKTLVEDWPALWSNGPPRHEEALGAMLLVAADAGGGPELLAALLAQRADVDVMTDQGWTALMLTVAAGQEDVARVLIAADADVDAKGAGGGRTALMLAVAAGAGAVELVQALVEKRANLDIVARSDGKTALLQAVESRSWAVAHLLVEQKAWPDAQRYDGRTALVVAAELGEADLVQKLIEMGANLSLKTDDGKSALLAGLAAGRLGVVGVLAEAADDLEDLLGRERRTVLMHAAAAGHVEVVRMLAEQRALLEARQPDTQETALAIAAGAQRWSVVRCLAYHDASLDVRCSHGSTVLTLAAAAGDLKLVAFLASHKANLDLPDSEGKTPLILAAVRGHLEIIQALAERNADLNASTEGCDAALVAAAAAKKWAAVQLLATLGARLEVRDPLHRTALIIAAVEGNSKTLCLLIEKRARLEARGGDGRTAITAAARERQWMIVRRLADAKADLEAVPEDDTRSVIVLAAEILQWETMEHLALKKADLNLRGTGGKTALMFAAECGQEDVVKVLLKCRAAPDKKCSKGETALMRACNRQLEGTMRALWEGGASVDEAIRAARIPSMGQLLREWAGDNVDDLY